MIGLGATDNQRVKIGSFFKRIKKIKQMHTQKLTSDQIGIIYDRSFAKLKTLTGTMKFVDYSKVCTRIMQWKINRMLNQ